MVCTALPALALVAGANTTKQKQTKKQKQKNKTFLVASPARPGALAAY